MSDPNVEVQSTSFKATILFGIISLVLVVFLNLVAFAMHPCFGFIMGLSWGWIACACSYLAQGQYTRQMAMGNWFRFGAIIGSLISFTAFNYTALKVW